MSEPRSPCIWCGAELNAPGAAKCTTCNSWQERNRCVVCSEPIPKAASSCNACKSMQSAVHRHLSLSQTTLALLVALVSVLTPAVSAIGAFLNRHSNTSVALTDATKDAIVMTVVNTGRSASVIEQWSLDFGTLPLLPMTLVIAPEDVGQGVPYVAPGKATIHLQRTELGRTRGTKQQIAEMLAEKRDVTLTVAIRESNGRLRRESKAIPAVLIRDFVLEGLVDD